jgi:DNA sulfur modification protein DndB
MMIMDENGLPSVAPMKTLPVMRGVQAGRVYYLSMCHLSFVAKNFTLPAKDTPEHKIIQRQMNQGRIPKIADYLIRFHDNYVLPPIIVSIDGETEFTPLSNANENLQMGMLSIPETADFHINDGQHRCAAIRKALEERPEMKLETIGVAFFIDRGVTRSRQMFSDLNGHPVRTNSNINATFDNREFLPAVTKRTIEQSPVLRDRVERFASSCARGSPRLFTISALVRAHGELVRDSGSKDREETALTCIRFWRVLQESLPELEGLLNGESQAKTIKEKYLYPYSIALQGLAGVANQLIREKPKKWEQELSKVEKINWTRDNPDWEGRAMTGGRITNGGQHPAWTRNYFKLEMGMKLSEEEKQLETFIGA